MKVKDLIEELKLADPEGIVVIDIDERGGIGASASAGITFVSSGFDWNRGKVFIHSDVALCKAINKDWLMKNLVYLQKGLDFATERGYTANIKSYNEQIDAAHLALEKLK